VKTHERRWLIGSAIAVLGLLGLLGAGTWCCVRHVRPGWTDCKMAIPEHRVIVSIQALPESQVATVSPTYSGALNYAMFSPSQLGSFSHCGVTLWHLPGLWVVLW
jgi:hypothetical protein